MSLLNNKQVLEANVMLRFIRRLDEHIVLTVNSVPAFERSNDHTNGFIIDLYLKIIQIVKEASQFDLGALVQEGNFELEPDEALRQSNNRQAERMTKLTDISSIHSQPQQVKKQKHFLSAERASEMTIDEFALELHKIR